MKDKLKKLAEDYTVSTEAGQALYDELCVLFNVVGQSEQLLAFKKWERNKCKLPWDAEPKEIVEQYLSQ